MKIIEKYQYYTLLGLYEMSKRHYNELSEIEKAAQEITGEKNAYGHTCDFLAGNRSLDEMLGILKIEVKK